MAAIVRVKRKRTAEAVEALVLSSKRCKNDTEADQTQEDDIQSIFLFAATVSKQDIPLSKHIKDVISKNDSLKRKFKLRHVDVVSKSRKEHHLACKASRYKLLGTYRNVNIDELDQLESCSNIEERVSGSKRKAADVVNLYDIEHEDEEIEKLAKSKASQDIITCNNVPMTRQQIESLPNTVSDNSDYVFDLYYLNDPYDNVVQELVTIEPCKPMIEEINFDPEDTDIFEDEDDSNDEDNWRNDYPDEDACFEKEYDYYKDYYEDITDDMAGCTLHDSWSDAPGGNDDIVLDNYTRYKARLQKELYLNDE